MAPGQLEEVVYNDPNSGTITKWKVQEGKTVMQNDIICEYKTSKSNKLRSTFVGRVTQILKRENESVHCGEVLLVIEKCSHATMWKNICTDCGTLVDGDAANNDNTFAMMHNMPDLLVSKEKALDLGKAEKNRLLYQKKLSLIVDLDQTIIHTTNDQVPHNLKDVFHFQIPQTGEWFHTKLRPHFEKFLSNVSKCYELHVFTLGVRSYARAITKFLDPKKRFFQQRILSRDECFHQNLKTVNLKHLFPCGDNMVCIIDDREDVWRSAANMIQVKPYSFFDGCADINAPPSSIDSRTTKSANPRKQTVIRIPKKIYHTSEVASSSTDKEVRSKVESKEFTEMIEWEDNDDYLLHLENILIKIHTSFYAQYVENNYNPETCTLDLKNIVPCEKKKVLQGCNILFSGVVPTNGKIENTLAYRLAVNCGANVQKELITEGHSVTTHVIAMRDGTKKVRKAQMHKIHAVNIDWLLGSIERWEKVNESVYPVPKEPQGKYLQYCKTDRRCNPKCDEAGSGMFRGCNILFSGVVPLNQKVGTSWAHELAVKHGANVQTELVLQGGHSITTHLVGMEDGTENVKKALSNKIHAVNIDWLLESIEKSVRVDERFYPISMNPSTKHLNYSQADRQAGEGERLAKQSLELHDMLKMIVDELSEDSDDGDGENMNVVEDNKDVGSRKRKHEDEPEDIDSFTKRLLFQLENE